MLNKDSQKRKELGCRYSSLLQLSYFDPIKMLIIDPMHNLYSGTAKYMVPWVWIDHGYLDGRKLAIIEDRLASVSLPSMVSIRRLPASIDPTTKLTAEQCMNWVNYFSIFCLHELLPSDHIECWRHFVLASWLLCKPTLNLQEVTVADTLLLRFCQRFQRLYGTDSVPPNMHMHCHLAL